MRDVLCGERSTLRLSTGKIVERRAIALCYNENWVATNSIEEKRTTNAIFNQISVGSLTLKPGDLFRVSLVRATEYGVLMGKIAFSGFQPYVYIAIFWEYMVLIDSFRDDTIS